MKKESIILILVILTLGISGVHAQNEWEIEHEFQPTDFLFCYSDHNTTTYEGDLGLMDTYCNNTKDNKTYGLSLGTVRGIAYATKKTFKFDEDLIMTHSSGKEPKLILTIKYKNGTTIPVLDYDTKTLTKEQMSYFDDYYNQKTIHDQNKEYWQQADMEDTISRSSAKSSDKKGVHRYVGTNGYGYMIDY